VKAEPAAAAAAAPQKPKLIAGKAIVKAVQSGDSLILVGSAATPGQAAPEKVIQLGGISAPRFARGKKDKDEPYAWESREYLRNLILGKVVEFKITYKHESSGREVADVKLDDKNLAQALVAAGWAKVREQKEKKDGKVHPERQALLDLQAQAEAAGLGLHNKNENAQQHVRKIDWTPDAKKLYDQYKGRSLPAIVDYVRDGSTLRLEIFGKPGDDKPSQQHTMITLFLAGVQAPKIPPPPRVQKEEKGDDDEEEEAPKPKAQPQQQRNPEPFAFDAKNFVDTRLLHREVGVLLQGIDKSGNLFGSIVHHKGNIAVELLKSGLATLVDWSAQLTQDTQAMREAERSAKESRLNKWRNYNPAKDQNAYTAEVKHVDAEQASINDKVFSAKVSQVVSGDCLVVQDNGGRTKRIYLASVTAPKLGNARRGAADEAWAAEAKEFMRKKLIAKRVKVVVEYSRGNKGEEARAFTSVYAGNAKKNVAEELVAAGFADVVKHRVDEPRAQHYDLLVLAEEQAVTKKLGKHSDKKPPVQHITDLSERFARSDKPKDGDKADEKKKDEEMTPQKLLSAKAKQFLTFLQKESDLKGVVEFVFSGSRLKVFIPKHSVMISFVLAGIKCPLPPPANQTRKDFKPEPFGKEALEMTRTLTLQQDVRLDIETLDRGDNFVGSVFVGRENLSVLLLKEGYASVFGPSADRSKNRDALYAAQQEAQTAKKAIWANWTPAPPKPIVVETEIKAQDDDKPVPEEQQFINIQITEIVDAATFWANVAGSPQLLQVEDKMKAFSEAADADENPKAYTPEKHTVCGGRFNDGNWYRVRLESKTQDGQWRAHFIDFGNDDVLNESDIRPLDKELSKLPPQAKFCVLAGVRAPAAANEYYDIAKDALYDMAYGRKLLAKIQMREDQGRKLHLTLHDAETPESINQLMLRDGLVRLANRPPPRLRKLVDEMRADEEYAKDQHFNLWEYGVVSDDEEEEPRGGARPKSKGGDKDAKAKRGP